MKIVHVIDYFQPQLGYQETFLPREQAKMGHDVYMITSDRYSPLLYQEDAVKSILGKRFKGHGFNIEEGIKTWRLKTLFEIPHEIFILGFEKKIQELKPDIVHMHGIVNFSAIRIARLKRKKERFKLIYDDHMTFGASRSILKILYPIFRWTFAQMIHGTADALVGVSHTSKMFMNKKYGFPLEDIDVIPLGADDTRFRFDIDARYELRRQLAINENDIVFIYAGKVVPVKGPHILVEAASKLMLNHDGLKVLVVGNGPQAYIEKMKQDINAKNMTDRFIWHDAVPNKELYKFYSAADVAIWPREASLSMMEAMGCGLPVIRSSGSEVSERLEYDNGLTYQNEDPSDLAQQMEKLLNTKLRVEMGRNSRKLVEDKFNWRIIANQFIESVGQK